MFQDSPGLIWWNLKVALMLQRGALVGPLGGLARHTDHVGDQGRPDHRHEPVGPRLVLLAVLGRALGLGLGQFGADPVAQRRLGAVQGLDDLRVQEQGARSGLS